MGEPYRRKLKGHVLVSVGSRYGFPFKGIDRTTKARCECGAESPDGLKTIGERREWHNQHKGNVLSQEPESVLGKGAGVEQVCAFKGCRNSGVPSEGYTFYACDPCLEELERLIQQKYAEAAQKSAERHANN